jgi:calcineurin-like phosphoesterase family protein
VTLFFTSDTHFGHARIIELCNRPFASVEEMNEAMIDNWNSVVGPKDSVVHLGDVALGPWVEWDGILSRLNGFKSLVVGNHDRVFAGMKEKERIRFHPVYKQWFEGPMWHNQPLYMLLDTQEMNAYNVSLSHFPYDGDSHGEDRHSEYRLPDNGTTLIHGHTHSSEKVSRSAKGTLQIHVGVDAHNYYPVSEEWIVQTIREQSQ